MSIPTGDITNHSLLWYNPNDGRVVHSNAGTTGRFGGAALDTEDLPTAVSALRRSSTYNPPVFGEGLDTTIVAEHSTVVGSQDTPVMSIPDYVTAVGNCSLSGKLERHATIVGTRGSSGTCGLCSIGIGYAAGEVMGTRCVSVGNGTMLSNSAMTGPDYTVAIGDFAGGYNAGAESLYLGAGAGLAGGNFNNVICIGRINPTQSDSFFVKPVRKVDGSGAGPVPEPLHYIEATGEIVHVPLSTTSCDTGAGMPSGSATPGTHYTDVSTNMTYQYSGTGWVMPHGSNWPASIRPTPCFEPIAGQSQYCGTDGFVRQWDGTAWNKVPTSVTWQTWDGSIPLQVAPFLPIAQAQATGSLDTVVISAQFSGATGGLVPNTTFHTLAPQGILTRSVPRLMWLNASGDSITFTFSPPLANPILQVLSFGFTPKPAILTLSAPFSSLFLSQGPDDDQSYTRPVTQLTPVSIHSLNGSAVLEFPGTHSSITMTITGDDTATQLPDTTEVSWGKANFATC